MKCCTGCIHDPSALVHHVGLAGTLEKQGAELSMAYKSDPRLRVAEMLPCNSLTMVKISFIITAFFLWHFAAFFNLVLNCLKGFHDWQLLGHVN